VILQLSLDFDQSKAFKSKSKRKKSVDLQLFSPEINIDIYLHNNEYAIAQIISKDVDMAIFQLEKILGKVTMLRNKKVMFKVNLLDRLLDFRPPSRITLDAATLVIARALWASKLGLSPLIVEKVGRRITGYSRGWPKLFNVRDVPWSSIAAVYKMGLELHYKGESRKYLVRKFSKVEECIAQAGLIGNTIRIDARYYEAFEGLNILGVQYAGPHGSGKYKLPVLCGTELLKYEQIKITGELEKKIVQLTKDPTPIKKVDGMTRELYPFQSVDIAKATRVIDNTGSVLLAGEMGSGKTTMTIALMYLYNMWPSVVVAPLSAFKTWSSELLREGKRVYMVTGNVKENWQGILAQEYDVLLVSYDRLHVFQEAIEQVNFRCLVADEVQRIRTPGSRRSRSLRALSGSTHYRIGLSGTPITNTVSDILPIGSFLSPTEWRPRSTRKDLGDIYPGFAEASLSAHINSMMVRRRMTDVGARLPKRNDHRVYVELSQEQVNQIANLESELLKKGKEGFFNDKKNKIHAFAKLQHMRKIINSPDTVGIIDSDPKTEAAIGLVKDFVNLSRKGVLFCADRATFVKLGKLLDREKIKWVGIWGSTPVEDRISNEKKFHEDPEVMVVLCTIQAGSESWSASPTATWLIATSYMYAPSMLAQMESRVYRMNSDPDGPDIEIIYIHATTKEGTLDDRMVEILGIKKEMFSKIVDRVAFKDTTTEHYSMDDLAYLLTGKKLKVAKRSK
jgi:superfamily II DNA or RNA helicase